jgi:deoxyribodipyrimidine photo-lyase
MKQKINIFWMRRDLRLEDNHALFRALSSGLPVRILFIFDDQILGKLDDKSDRRVTFIIERLTHLNKELAGYNSVIDIRHGNPAEIFKLVFDEFDVEGLFLNRDYEPYALKRDTSIREMCLASGVSFQTFKDHLIFENGEILKNDDSPYTVYTPFSKRWRKALSESHLQTFESERLLKNLQKYTGYPNSDLYSLTGFHKTEIINTVPDIPDGKALSDYAELRNIPWRDSTTRLGHHLRFGTISIRKLVSLAAESSDVFLGELIWREFFSHILAHYPHVENSAFKKQYDLIPWRNDTSELERWKNGTTGFPLVDAGMRQLKETGFMHNRVRMVTAGFLIKDLLVDWRIGEAWFAKHLLDYELASNNGNWQWAAGTGCDAAPYFRVFNPITQQERFDPEFRYIKQWVPEFGTTKYPAPMTDHKLARLRAIDVYKSVLK